MCRFGRANRQGRREAHRQRPKRCGRSDGTFRNAQIQIACGVGLRHAVTSGMDLLEGTRKAVGSVSALGRRPQCCAVMGILSYVCVLSPIQL